MNRFSISIIVLISVAAVVCGRGWQASHKALQTTLEEEAALSNRLSEATLKLGEKEATVQTLTVKQNLQGADFAALTNQINSLRAELAGALDKSRQIGIIVRTQEAQLVAGQQQLDAANRNANGLEQQIKGLQDEIAVNQTKIKSAHQKVADLANRLNISEAAQAHWLRQWNDPSVVRAQSRALAKEVTSISGPALPVKRPPLAIQPDGKVAMVPTSGGTNVR